MKNKKILLLIIGLIAFISTNILAGSTINLNFEKENLTISKKDGYDIVILNDCFYPVLPGAPQLPAKTIFLIIPQNNNVESITINDYKKTTPSGLSSNNFF